MWLLGKRINLLVGCWPTRGFQWSSEWLHIHEHMGTDNWVIGGLVGYPKGGEKKKKKREKGMKFGGRHIKGNMEKCLITVDMTVFYCVHI